MTTLRLSVILMLMLANLCPAQEGKFAEHIFYKHLIGKWTASGELTKDDGGTVTITEEWEGKATEEGFIIEGRRMIDGNPQSFRWVTTHNPSTDSYDTIMTNDGKDAEALRFEGHISEVALTLELKTTLGSGGSLTVLDSFADEGKDKNTLESQVTFTGDTGSTTMSGKITHKKAKAS